MKLFQVILTLASFSMPTLAFAVPAGASKCDAPSLYNKQGKPKAPAFVAQSTQPNLTIRAKQ